MPHQRSIKYQVGFTLIELLVVISIIAILSVIGLVSYQLVLKNGRDAKRQSDLRTVQSALEQYRTDLYFYPSAITFGQPLTSSTGNPSPPPTTRTYVNTLPENPLPSPQPQYKYDRKPDTCDNAALGKCTSYCLWAKMENTSSSPPPAPCPSTIPAPYNYGITSP